MENNKAKLSNEPSQELKDLARRNVSDLLKAIYGVREAFDYIYGNDKLDLEESDVHEIVGSIVVNVLNLGKYEELLEPEDEGKLVILHEILDEIQATNYHYKYDTTDEVEICLVDQIRYVLEDLINRTEAEVEERL